jgi:hypothetical protein
LNVATDGHGGTLITDPPGTSPLGPSVSIGGPSNENFVFHSGIGGSRPFDPPAAETEFGQFSSHDEHYWATFIKQDAMEFVTDAGGAMPPDLDASNWHLALQHAFHLH